MVRTEVTGGGTKPGWSASGGRTTPETAPASRPPAWNLMLKLYWEQSSTGTVIKIVLFRNGGVNLVGLSFLLDDPDCLAMV